MNDEPTIDFALVHPEEGWMTIDRTYGVRLILTTNKEIGKGQKGREVYQGLDLGPGLFQEGEPALGPLQEGDRDPHRLMKYLRLNLDLFLQEGD